MIIPILIVGGVGVLGAWLYLRGRPPAPQQPIITVGGGVIVGGGTQITQPGVVVDPVAPAPDNPPPPVLGPGGTPDDPAQIPMPGSYYYVAGGSDVGCLIVAQAYGLENDDSGRRVRNWEMVRRHALNKPLRKKGATVWSGYTLRAYKGPPGQHPEGSGIKKPVIWIPPLSEVVP